MYIYTGYTLSVILITVILCCWWTLSWSGHLWIYSMYNTCMYMYYTCSYTFDIVHCIDLVWGDHCMHVHVYALWVCLICVKCCSHALDVCPAAVEREQLPQSSQPASAVQPPTPSHPRTYSNLLPPSPTSPLGSEAKEFIEPCVEFDATADFGGRTALHLAIAHRHTRVTEILLSHSGQCCMASNWPCVLYLHVHVLSGLPDIVCGS